MEKQMKMYELVLVIAPENESSKTDSLLVKITKIVEELGGKIEKTDLWGKRHLAYPIKKNHEGVYFLFTLNLLPAKIIELERKIRLEEQIIRHLLIVK